MTDIPFNFRANGADRVASDIAAINKALERSQQATRSAAVAAKELARGNSDFVKLRIAQALKDQGTAAANAAKEFKLLRDAAKQIDDPSARQRALAGIQSLEDATREVTRAQSEAAKAAQEMARANAEVARQKTQDDLAAQAKAAKDAALAQKEAAKAAQELSRANAELAKQKAAEALKEQERAAKALASAQEKLARASDSGGFSNLANSLGTSFGDAQKFAQSLGLTGTQAEQAIAKINQLNSVNATTQQKFNALNKELGINSQQFLALDKAVDQYNQSAAQSAQALQRQAAESDRLSKELRDLEEQQQRVGFAAAGFATAGTLALTSLVGGAIAARREYEGLIAALNSSTGGQGAEAFEFINQEVDRLKLNLPAATSAFTQLSAAAKGTELEGAGVEKIFSAIAQAGRVNNLSLERQEKAYLAVTQVISKGVLQQEELRGQLSEALPGAVQIFARALGVTTAELGKLITAGEVGLPELLKFAEQLENETAGGVDAATQTIGASLDQLSTEFNRFQVASSELLTGPTIALANLASATLRGFGQLNPAIQKGIILIGGLTAAYTLLIAAQIADNQLKITSTALQTAQAIKTIALTQATAALAAAQAVLATVTKTANASQLSLARSLGATALKAGVLGAAVGAIALNVGAFRVIDAEASKTRESLEEARQSFEKFLEASARSSSGADQVEAIGTAAEQTRARIENSIGGLAKFADEIIKVFNLIDPAVEDSTTFAEAAVSRQQAAFFDLVGAIEGDVLTAYEELKNAPGGLAAASDEEISALLEAVSAYDSALQNSAAVTDNDVAVKNQLIGTLANLKSNLEGVTVANDKATKSSEDAIKALREAAQEQRDIEFEDAERQRSRDLDDEREQRRIDIENRVAAIQQANEDAIATAQEANELRLQETQRSFDAEQQQLQEEGQRQIQALESAFNADQQAKEERFQRNQQGAAARFNDEQRQKEQAFQDAIAARRRAAEGEFDARQQQIDRQLQLEFAGDRDERARLREQFEQEDRIANRRAQLEADLVADRQAFEDQVRAEEAAFQQQQRVEQASFDKAQQAQAAAFQQQQQAQQANFETTTLNPLRQQLESQIEQRKLDFETNTLKPLRQQQEAEIEALKLDAETAIARLRADNAATERQLDRNEEDARIQRERDFKAEQRRLDTANAEEIARILRESIEGATPPTSFLTGGAGGIAGARRDGGAVEAGQVYRVGEAGPELFVSPANGYIIRKSQAEAIARQAYAPSAPPRITAPSAYRGSGRAGKDPVLKELQGLRADVQRLDKVSGDRHYYQSNDAWFKRMMGLS